MAKPAALLEALTKFLPDPLGERLADHARLMTLRAGQIVIGHQDETSDVFVVLEGNLRVELASLNGREIILADAGPGDLVGEFAAIDDQPRSATVTAISAVVLASIPGAAFRTTVLGDPGSADWIAQRLVRHIRLLTERIFELNTLAVRSRLHCELLRLCLGAGIADNRACISPAPTHVQFASRIGTHREAVTRELQYLQKQDIAIQQGRELRVNDVEKLAEIVRAAAGDVSIVSRALRQTN